jgi:fimbrial chaperone protein
MHRLSFGFAALCAGVSMSCGLASAASLTITPVLLEAIAPQQATVVTLQNKSNKPINGQVRIFTWRQAGGEDILEPATQVVASPPIVSLRPGTDHTIRVIRLAKTPVTGEESYRVIIDELPDADERRNGIVAIALRYVIPAFFFEASRGQPRISWFITRENGARYLVAQNDGDRRARIADLMLDNKIIAGGLAGYVLGHSQRKWKIDPKIEARQRRVTAQSDLGAINDTALLREK